MDSETALSEGQDELEPAGGWGWVVIENEELQGRIFLHHQGDVSAFRAMKIQRVP